jgi:hypothetical protein
MARRAKARAECLRMTVQGTAFVTQYNYPAVGRKGDRGLFGCWLSF